jgi:hypothetical protein
MALGTASSTYTMSGLPSAASAATQTGPLELVTTDSGGNLASDGGATQAAIAMNAAAINELRGDVNRAFRRLDDQAEGIALAMAMGGLFMPSDKTFAISANMGFFDGKQAVAAQGAVRLDNVWVLQGGIGVGVDGGNVGGRIGISAAW